MPLPLSARLRSIALRHADAEPWALSLFLRALALRQPIDDNSRRSLQTLTLSGSLEIGVATSGSIFGATAGSTIVSNIPGITVNSGLRTYSGTATAAGDGITETLSGALGSPKKSPIAVTAAPQTATIANTNGNSALLGSNVSGFAAPADALDGRLAAAGL